MWFFRHFWIFISYHIFLLNQVEGAIAIPPSNSAPLPLFCPSVCPSVCPSIGLLTTFSGFCTFADKSLGRNGIELEMQMFPDDLPFGQHWCRWVLLSFHAFVRPSNHPWAWVCVLHTKRLEEMAYNLACWCIQMAYTQHSWMLMDIVVGLSVRPSVRLFVYGIFRWLCICWQIIWNKWHKIWHDDVVIIGRWLLPSLVDTGDICCHYWQLILVIIIVIVIVIVVVIIIIIIVIVVIIIIWTNVNRLVLTGRFQRDVLYTMQYTPKIEPMVYALLFFVMAPQWSNLPISIRVTSLALGQSYDCPVPVKPPPKIWVSI